MRTPLAVLRVHAQNVLEAQNDAQRRESLNYLVVGVDRTTRLVNQLLTIARLEPGTGPVKTQQGDLVAAVRETLAQMTPWILSRSLELSFECNQQAHLLNTDFAAIDIALQNLITNAVNFSPANGLISVTLALKNDGYELSVSDQGPGISESDRERLFERFYSKGNNQGVGLGLAIVQTVAMRLGGKVRLENRVPTGLISILAISVATQ
jgi:two-component system sensor histidine kinase QseC